MRLKLLGVAVIAALCFAAYAIGAGISSNRERTDENGAATAQLCVFVDDEHNADRAEIVRAEREIYHPPPTTPDSFREFIAPFIDTPEERAELHRKNKEMYDKIRTTRPDYCKDVRKNPVKPYPTLKEIVP